MTTLKIRESAIVHNVGSIRAHTNKRIIAVIKEDGYGMGLGNAYAVLKRCGIDYYAVATPWEALRLSRMSQGEDILLLTPEQNEEALLELIRRGIVFMLAGGEQADALRRAGARAGCTPRVHLKLDTGLGRYGYAWNDLSAVAQDVQGLKLEGCYTHFATQSRAYLRNIRRQFARFEQALSTLRGMGLDCGMTHACASRAFAGVGDLGLDAIRVGSLLLGRCAGPLAAEFENAVYMEAQIFQTRLHFRGETVGYDGRVRLKRDTLVGLVRVGYADGAFLTGADHGQPSLGTLARCLLRVMRGGGAARVRVGERFVPILGKIGMNHMLLDLTGVPAGVGAPVRVEISPLLVRSEIPRQLC